MSSRRCQGRRQTAIIASNLVYAATLVFATGVWGDETALPRTVVSIDSLPERPLAQLSLLATLAAGPGTECSGIIASGDHADLFWTINDSGNEPRIFPIHRNGDLVRDANGVASSGVLIQRANNVDWEDITADGDGHLIVCDVGNNLNARRDLVLYFVNEPAADTAAAPVAQRFRVRYPDQQEFPAPADNMNFDCEAVFVADGKVHLLTKHRSDLLTNLYRLDDPNADTESVLTYLGTFDSRGPVTAADASDDGLRMVLITYSAIWMFERDDVETPFFESRVFWAPYLSIQMESVCFADDDSLLLVDEKLGMLFELPISELTQVR